MTKINELYALPVGLRKVIVVDGIPLYGSDSLNKKYIESLENSKYSTLLSGIKSMVESGKVIPCFTDGNLITYFRRKISKNTSGGLMTILRALIFGLNPIEHPFDKFYAWYDYTTDKIIILINNHYEKGTLENEVNDNQLSMVTIHELAHMSSNKSPNSYYNLFKDEIDIFYKTFFTKLFKLKENDNVDILTSETAKFLYFKFETEKNHLNYLEPLHKQLSKFKKYTNDVKGFDKIVEDYIKLIVMFWKLDFLTFVKNVKDRRYILRALAVSFKICFKKVPQKGFFQELYLPSEVIAGFVEIKKSPKIKKMISLSM